MVITRMLSGYRPKIEYPCKFLIMDIISATVEASPVNEIIHPSCCSNYWYNNSVYTELLL